jgi:prolyl-tRNA editing enzyme YbaK/EbsC (Cys-tRNA(Pro) deacylase)
VNPDCTGSFTITIFPIGLTQHIDFVIDDDGLEFRAISAESGDVLTAVGRKQFRQGR